MTNLFGPFFQKKIFLLMTGGSLNFKDFFRKLAVLLLDVFIASSTVGGAWVKGCNTPLPAHNCCVSRREVQKKKLSI